MREWWDSGCKGSLTVRTWLLVLPPLIAFAVILILSRSQAPVGAGVLFVLSGYVAAGMAIYASRTWVNARPVQARQWWTLLALAAVGLITTTVARVASSVAGFPPQGAPLSSLLPVTAVFVLWLTVASLISFWLESDATMRRRLLRELARDRALAIDSSRYLEEDRRQLAADVQDTLRSRLGEVNRNDSEQLAPELDNLIATVIRPLSHKLHDERVDESALVQELQDLQVPPTRPLREYARSLSSPDPWALVLLAGMLATGVAAALYAARTSVSGIAVAAALIVLVVAAMVLVAVLVAARARAEDVREDLTAAVAAAEWASARLRQSAWVARRQLANSLHGNVQARVLATALRIRDEPTLDSVEEVRQLDAEISSLLRGNEAEADWRLAWDRFTHIWGFSIELDAQLAGDVVSALDTDPVAGQALVAVVGEAVTNAVRHGDARSVALGVEISKEDELLLTVTDDGPIDGTSSDPGLGTAVFEAACIEWNVTPTGTGHEFTARIPISSHSEKTEAALATI